MQKIKYIQGSSSCLIIAPHGAGPTDINTAIMSEIIAQRTNSHAVINVGWVRPWKGTIEGTNTPANNAHKSNLSQGIANLNDLNDCYQHPLKEDFMKPIDIYKNRINRYAKANIFIIHGMDDTIRDYNGVDVVIGFGNGKVPRHTCFLPFKDRFMGFLQAHNFTPANGKIGGRLSAWNGNNLNQLYTQDKDVNSLQIEIALTLRDTEEKAILTAERIAVAINRTCGNENSPTLKNIQER